MYGGSGEQAWRHEPHGTDLVSSATATRMVRCLPIALVAATVLLASVLGVAMHAGQAMQVPPSGPLWLCWPQPL
jgi:hypothetical protein